MKTKAKALVVGLLAALMLLQTGASAITYTSNFSDVSSGEWFYDPISRCSTLGIVVGFEDGRFYPNEQLKRGQFITMLACTSEQLIIPVQGSNEHWASKYYDALNGIKVFEGLDIDGYYQSLEAFLTRYEMAVMVENFLTNDQWESAVSAVSPERAITDYSAIPAAYRNSVVQVYGKGVISGYDDGSFNGERILTRAEACVVIKQILWAGERKTAGFVDTTVQTGPSRPSGYVPVATQWRNNGWIDGYGNVNASLKQILFGSSSKSYFTSSTDAANYMRTVTVPAWKLNSSGAKYASTVTLTVNKAVADDVVAIFTQIYNDPEKFPIESAGGARYTDTMRHAWGCAIDINAYYNAECRAYYNSDGSINRVVQTCGYGWWPLGTSYTQFAGSLSAANAYSIGAGSSVVRAFNDYGWGWAGNGYSLRSSDNSQKFDYMHFSVLSNGG